MKIFGISLSDIIKSPNLSLSAKDYTNKSIQTYPKWKKLIPEFPTVEQFIAAWYIVFEEKPDNCWLEQCTNNRIVVFTTNGRLIHHGGMCEITDTPNLKPGQEWRFKRGIDWDTDADGNRFYLIEKNGWPANWLENYSAAIIRQFILTFDKNKELFYG